MNITNAEGRWQQCLEMIKANVSNEQFNTWFKPIGYESYDDSKNTLTLKLPSQFVFEYLEQNFVDLLKKVLWHVFGHAVILQYRVLTDKTNNLSQNLESSPSAKIGKTYSSDSGLNKTPGVLDRVQTQELASQLNPKLTFANYIEGASNKLPRSVGMSISEHPNKTTFNPMFIYGPSGCGKTHLINAIGVKIKELYPQMRVLYVSARLFQVQYSNASIKNMVNDFIAFYQTIDVLIVDDIQEWASGAKEKTQNAFFHVFNHLFRNGKRIILACDRPPVDLKGMHERLLTRFSCGLIAELEKPNIQLCVDILECKIKRDGLTIPRDVIQYIAQTANGSVRDLEGVINSLLAYSVVYNSDIDMALAEKVIRRTVRVDEEKAPITIDNILEGVCKYFNVSTAQVTSRSRKQQFVKARQVSMFLAQKLTDMPASRIGKFIGGRDHSTVIHSCSQVEMKIKIDANFKEDIEKLENSFKSRVAAQ